MKSYMAKPVVEKDKKWFLVDAEGMVLGRLASQVASILRGKTEPTFTPHVDIGNCVVIINTDKIVLTGKKLEQKYHRTHSGKVGNLHETQYKKLMQERSDFVVLLAIKGMLPKNALGSKMLKKVRAYKGAEHNQQAQMPVKIELKG